MCNKQAGGFCLDYRRNCKLWWIQSVYVKPDHRRKGYFKQLYKHVRKVARQEDVGGLRLYADTTNEKAHATVSSLSIRCGPFAAKLVLVI